MLKAQLKELSLPRPSQEAGDILVLLRRGHCDLTPSSPSSGSLRPTVDAHESVRCLVSCSPTKPLNPVSLILLFHFWATLLDYSHFLPLYTSTFLKFAGEFCTFDSTTLIWLLTLPVALQITSCKVTISSNKCTFDTISMGDIYFYQIYKHNIFTYSTRITSGYFLQLQTCFTSKQINTFWFLPPASQPWSNQVILKTYCTKSLIWIKSFNSMFLLHFMLFYFSIICFHCTYVF